MKILITSGGTREYLDDVRVLTNISSGKLGSIIADKLMESVNEIHYVTTKSSFLPKNNNKLIIHYVTNVQSVYDTMKELVPDMDVVIHSMAVSDFGFKPTGKKIKSDDIDGFIDTLKSTIYKTPKILSYIKNWNPNTYLISFKFEVGKNYNELIDIAYDSLIKNGCDLVVANDKKEMKNKNSHVAYIIDNNKNVISCSDKEDIATKIKNYMN